MTGSRVVRAHLWSGGYASTRAGRAWLAKAAGVKFPSAEWGSLLVIVAPPFLDALPSIGQRQEPRGVQALGSQPGVERLDERVIQHDAAGAFISGRSSSG
jgi:hypothetical protein